MTKKISALITGLLLAAPFAGAQEDRGEQTAGIAPATPTTTVAAVGMSDGKKLNKEVIVAEETEKWWSVKASTGWDSLYMFRGVNVLGNGNGIYWMSGSAGVTPWENGAFTATIWYGAGTSRYYGELDTTIDYTHTFGPLAASFGYINYYYPNYFFSGNYSQNELYWKLAYNQEVGPVTFTPSAIYYLELGPTIDDVNGLTKPGASYLYLRMDASMAVYKDIVSVAPWTGFGISFDYNLDNAGQFISGGNNWELGVSVPIQITDWFSVSGYVAYSYQWMDLYETAPNTVWAGASATFTF